MTEFLNKKFMNLGKSRVSYLSSHNTSIGEDEDSSPILMLHGFPSSSSLWNFMIPSLETDFSRIIAPDLAGLGDTITPMDMDFGIEAQGTMAYQFFRHYFGNEKGIIIGHEIGASIALTLALHKPGMVKAVILIAGSFYNNWPTKIMKPFKLLAPSPLLYNSYMKSGAALSIMRKQIISSFYSFDPSQEWFIDECIRPLKNSHSAKERTRKLLRDLNPRLTTTFSKHLYRLKIPVLIIWGKNDKILLPKEGHRLNSSISGSTLVQIDDCGHFPTIEQPEQAASLIKSFIRQLP